MGSPCSVMMGIVHDEDTSSFSALPVVMVVGGGREQQGGGDTPSVVVGGDQAQVRETYSPPMFPPAADVDEPRGDAFSETFVDCRDDDRPHTASSGERDSDKGVCFDDEEVAALELPQLFGEDAPSVECQRREHFGSFGSDPFGSSRRRSVSQHYDSQSSVVPDPPLHLSQNESWTTSERDRCICMSFKIRNALLDSLSAAYAELNHQRNSIVSGEAVARYSAISPPQ